MIRSGKFRKVKTSDMKISGKKLKEKPYCLNPDSRIKGLAGFVFSLLSRLDRNQANPLILKIRV
jgi:hypothetical protein